MRSGEIYRTTIVGFLFFFLIAANNLIKIARDSVFLGHHSVSELPYLYILVALTAGTVIALYARVTATLTVSRLILLTYAIVFLNIIFFWLLITYLNPGWSHYAFFVWSAITGAITVAQAWTFVHQVFTKEEGERLFGLIMAGGTVGGTAAAFGAKWALENSIESIDLLWPVAGCLSAASVLVSYATRESIIKVVGHELEQERKSNTGKFSGVVVFLSRSGYLRTITLLILVSVIVSSLIDFEFKAAAKETYPSQQALAGFFASYYGWLSILTFIIQVFLSVTRLSRLGLFPSHYLTPAFLLTGSVVMVISPSLLAATVTRITDSILRNSIHRRGIELLYIPLPTRLRKTVKPFLDVVGERVGDATAGVMILLVSFFAANGYVATVHFINMGLLLAWILLIPVLRVAYTSTIRRHTRSPSSFSAERLQEGQSSRQSFRL